MLGGLLTGNAASQAPIQDRTIRREPIEETVARQRPPAVATNGRHRADIVTQQDLRQIALLQAAAWQAEEALRQALALLARRFRHGATIEDGDLYLDCELEVVGSIRKEMPS